MILHGVKKKINKTISDDNGDDDINALETRVRCMIEREICSEQRLMMFLLRDNDN